MATVDDKHTLTYLVVTTKKLIAGPQKIITDVAESSREKLDTYKMVASQNSDSTKFAMQNHVAASATGGWWSADASHDDDYETNTSHAKQMKDEIKKLTDKLKKSSIKSEYTLTKGDIYLEYMEIKCHKIGVKEKKEEHCIHYPGKSSTSGPMSKRGVQDLARLYFLDFETWKPVFAKLGMTSKEMKTLTQKRICLEKKLKVKMYKPKTILDATRVRLSNSFKGTKHLGLTDKKKKPYLFKKADGIEFNWEVRRQGARNTIRLYNDFAPGAALAKTDGGTHTHMCEEEDGSQDWEVIESPKGPDYVRLKNKYMSGKVWLAACDDKKQVVMGLKDDGDIDWKVRILR